MRHLAEEGALEKVDTRDSGVLETKAVGGFLIVDGFIEEERWGNNWG